jgi:hypothetical protein
MISARSAAFSTWKVMSLPGTSLPTMVCHWSSVSSVQSDLRLLEARQSIGTSRPTRPRGHKHLASAGLPYRGQSVASAAALFEQLFAASGGLSGSKHARARHEHCKRREECGQDIRFPWLRQVIPRLPNRTLSLWERASNQLPPGCVSS